MTERVIVEADGGSRGNPGPAGYGALVRDAETGAVLAERSAALGIETNNVAEYRGLIAGLEAANELGARQISVRMDSKLVVEQMTGRWQVKHAGLRPLARKATSLVSGFDSVTFDWVPRAQNAYADRLANEAMDAAAGIPVKTETESDAQRREPSPSWVLPDMTPTRFLLLRHGATEHSQDQRFSGRNSLPLSPQGQEQARWLATRLASFTDIAAVVSSPLPRAVQTAQIVAEALNTSVIEHEGLVETDFGAWEGLTFAEVQQKWPAELEAWLAAPEIAPPQGESFNAVGRRVRRARDEITARYSDRTIVIVTHVTPIKTLLCTALGAPPVSMFRLHLDAGSLSIVDYFADGNASVRLVNETSADSLSR